MGRSRQFKNIHLALLDSYAQLQLARGRLDDCEARLDEIARLSPDGGDFRPSWLDLWIHQTRVRLLQRRGRWAEAADLATRALDIAGARSDRLLGALFATLKADSLVMLDRPGEAARLLASAAESCDASQLETVAEIERVRGKALAHQGCGADARAHLLRAERIADVLGNACLRAGIDADRSHVEAAREATGTSAGPAPALDDAAVLLELGGQPELLGREAIALLARLGYPGSPTLVVDGTRASAGDVDEAAGRSRDGATTPMAATTGAAAGQDDPVRIDLGEVGGRRLLLRVAPPRARGDVETLSAVRRLVGHARRLEAAASQLRRRTSFWEVEPAPERPDGGVFAAASMLETLDAALKAAPTDIPILLTGETGTGKELLARAIHDASARAARTFQPFDCNSVPRDLLDSHLFGHRRGAFTGATDSFRGVIRTAEGGTLFLDEIGELGAELQPKLLRFLETGQIHPLGESSPVAVDVRVIAATNADLDRLVSAGAFREDLYYRLNVIRFGLPPLRERREEIPLLARHFLRRHADDQGRPVPRLTDEALEYLLLYRWPGNVRELGNEMRRLVAFAEPDGAIGPESLSPHIRATRRTVPAGEAETAASVRLALDQPLPSAMEQLERAMIEEALTRTGGRVEPAARLLGLSRKGLYLKRQRLQLSF